jgi:branched-chain amino acid transport system ATP-binding protein
MFFQTKNCGISFGGLQALSGLNLDVASGEIVGVIGPNGAGKTTFFNLITGVYEPTQGELYLAGDSLKGLRAYEIAQRGIARTFQNIRLFAGMSVLEQVLVAFNKNIRSGFGSILCQTQSHLKEEEACMSRAMDLLQVFNLHKCHDVPAASLSYGDQRRLEIIRALATNPKLLLLDEPAAGMNPSEKKDLIGLIRRIHKEFDLTLILIEHDMSVVMTLCPRILVLNYGEVIAEGSPEQIRENPDVIKAYLGDPNA